MNSDGMLRPSLSEIAGASEGTQPTGIEDRLAALEKKAPSGTETRFLRFGAIAGVLGTLLSIVNGGLTAYSSTVRQEQEARQKLFQEFSGYVQKLSEVDQKVVVVNASPVDQTTKYAQLAAASQESYIAANAAEELLPQIEKLVSASQLVLLGEAKGRSGDLKAARKYLDKAVDLSYGPMRAEILRVSGGILATSNDLADKSAALAAFSSAFDIVKDGNYWGASLATAGIVHDWVIVETYVGDCVKADSLLLRYVDLLSHQDVTDEARKFGKKTMRDSLVQNTRCRLDLGKLES